MDCGFVLGNIYFREHTYLANTLKNTSGVKACFAYLVIIYAFT